MTLCSPLVNMAIASPFPRSWDFFLLLFLVSAISLPRELFLRCVHECFDTWILPCLSRSARCPSCWNNVLQSYSWVMFSFPQEKLWMHCSTVLKYKSLLWKAGGQPDISSPCNDFVSSAQIPERFILEINLTKTCLGVEKSISKLLGIQHAISIHRSYFLCISGNSLARYGIHLPFPLLGFNTLETLVLYPGASLSSTCTSFSQIAFICFNWDSHQPSSYDSHSI